MEIHAAMVDRMDSEIGRVVKQIEAMGELDNTVIIFLSDNGASAEIMVRGGGHDDSAPYGSDETFLCLGPGWANMSNTPFRRYKVWTHEGGVATPFIVKWGKNVKNKGGINTTPSHLVDIMPTLLSLAGAKDINKTAPDAPLFPGKDLTASITDNADTAHEYIYFNHSKNFALRMGDWKIIQTNFKDEDPKWRLYNIKIDRGEQNDLSADEPERLKNMVAKWKELNTQFYKEAGVELNSDTGKKAKGKKKNNN